MYDLLWISFVMVLVLILLIMVMWLVRQLVSSYRSQLKQQLLENQKLRNLILSPDVQTLAGLNHTTLPAEEVASNNLEPEILDTGDLGEAINFEDRLAQQGFTVGDLGGLESSGWSPPVIRREGDDPVAYDLSDG